jgi:dihydrofolate reductase
VSEVFSDLGISLDGYVAGPNAGPDNALGNGGDRIHQWQYEVEAWRERQRRAGGAVNRDHEIATEKFERAGAYVMGRRMFGEGEKGWPEQREPWVRQGGTTFYFVTDGIASAIESARSVCGDKDVHVAGGANVVQQALNADLLDELQLHLAPVLLGGGVRLFDDVDPATCSLEVSQVVESPFVTHLWYRVVQ